jgi:hypothetical protein
MTLRGGTVKKVLLLLCQGTEVFEAAAFYDVMGWSAIDVALSLLAELTGSKNADHIRYMMGFSK